jgi:hypothetical protein
MGARVTTAQHRKLVNLRNALLALRVFETEFHDLAYKPGDVRGAIPDGEMPHDWLKTRDKLRATVTKCAALFCGETAPVAAMFADTPLAAINPYNVERARMAVALTGTW